MCCEHPASLGIRPSALQVSRISRHPLLLAPHRGGDKDGCKDKRKRSQTLRPPRLRSPQSKAPPGSDLLTYTVCQSQKTDWSVVAVGFSCSQSQPEMVCADSRQHPFPKSHFPSCIPSLQCIHTPQQQDSISSESIQALQSHKFHLLLIGKEANKKRPDGNYSFCSLGDGKESGAMIQPGTARLFSPYQYLKEPQGKG